MGKFLDFRQKNKGRVAVFLDNIGFLLDILKIGSGKKVFRESIESLKVLILLAISGF